MASFIANQVSKRILKESSSNNFGTQDAYYEQVAATDLNGKPTGKTSKRRRPIPEGISQHDAKILNKVKRRAHRLDSNINICGIRFGWGSLLGIIPGFGDVLDFFMAMMVYRTCDKIEGGLDQSTKNKMMMNIIIDLVIGFVPFLGDLADALFRCNTKNAMVLEEFLRKKGAKAMALDTQKNGTTQQPMFTDQPARTNMEYHEGGSVPGAPPPYATASDERDVGARTNPTRPEPTKAANGSGRGGWFGGFRNGRSRESDVERG